MIQSRRTGAPAADPEGLRRYGPLFFLLYCLLTIFRLGEQRALYFNPAEVNFLFAGPFTRRQLLVYKMTVQALIALPMALVFTAAFRVHARWDVAAFVGLYFLLCFLQFFAICVVMVIETIGTKAYTHARKLLLFVVIGVAAGVLMIASRQAGGFGALFQTVERTTAWKVVAAPLGTFIEAYLVQPGDWPELLRWGGLAGLVTLAVVTLLLLLDAHYLESAATSSERIYSQIQKMRRGEAMSLHWSGSDKARWGLPMFPGWGGMGPVAWRQMTTALRSLGRLAFIILVFAPMVLTPLFANKPGHPLDTLVFVMAMLTWLSMFLTTLVPFDFRGDVERMEVLKTLPVPAWRLVVGQMLAPIFILGLLQSLCLIALWAGGLLSARLFLVGVAFALPLNLLLFGLDNLIFLWFPSRTFAVNPGDFQALGRNVVMLIGKMLVLTAAVAATVGLGFLGHALTRSLEVAFVTGWVVLTAFAVTTVPLMALAFEGFDVSRDLPA
jgi:hypothetical protein